MKLTIFYSWQSRTDTKFNKNFIKDCIEAACRKVEKSSNPKLHGITFLLQEGVTGEAGSPPVADTIIKERISNCDIFIADLSVTDAPSKIERLFYKITKLKRQVHQANNVVYEYGYAHSILGDKKIIGVLNNVYGSPNINPDNIFFDIDHLRHPLEYSWDDKTIGNKPDVKKKFVDDLSVAISACAIESINTIKNKFYPFKTWSDHQQEQGSNNKFFENEKIIAVKEAIIQNGSNIRIVGLSGLGKTRIVTESYKSNDEDIAKLYLYCDYHHTIEESILGALDKIFRDEPSLHIVIDNCPLEFHRRILFLKNSIGASNPVLTIYNKPEEEYYDGDRNTRYILISPKDLISVVDDIVAEYFDALNEEQIKTIKDFSAGIPLMAVLLIESIRKGEEYPGRLDDKALVNKILLIDEKSQERKILQSFSIFDHLGYEGDLRGQMEFVAKNKNITPISEYDEVLISKFDEVFSRFHKREIFEKNGRLIRLRPVPLAIALTVEWFDRCTDETLLKIIDAFQDPANPYGKSLTNSFAERIRYLGFHDKAKDTLEKLIGVSSPFDNAKVVDTELGSRLFRSFVEVNPIAVTNNLTRNFGNLSLSQLENMTEGRRNLVWVLEKACFNKETFFDATKLLMSFAVAENETWGNNATGQFLQLFNIYLAGTESNLQERLEIIKWALSQDDAYLPLTFKAMGVALKSDHFARTGGAEKQGTKTLSDYRPTSEEISEYWKAILDILCEEVNKKSKYSDLSADIIANSTYGLLRIGVPGLIIPILMKVTEYKNYEWDGLLDILHQVRVRMKSNLHPNDFQKIENLISLLTRDTFAFKYISISKRNYREDAKLGWEKALEIQQNEYANLAERFIKEGFTEMDLETIYIKNHIISHPFGKCVAELLEHDLDQSKRFIDMSVKILLETDVKERNPHVLLNFAQGLNNDELKTYLAEALVSSSGLSYLIFSIFGLWAVPYKDIGLLFSLVSEKKADVSDFVQFINNYIVKVESDEIASLCVKLTEYGIDGKRVAAKVLYNYLTFEKEKSAPMIAALREILKSLSAENIIEFGVENFFECVKLILEKNDDNDFAAQIIQRIISLMGQTEHYIYNDHIIQEVVSELLSRYFDAIWPHLSDALLAEGEGFITFYHLQHLLENNKMGVEANNTIIMQGNTEDIFKWCSENPELAPARLAYLLPLYENGAFHPLTMRLLDEFGEKTNVLDVLSAEIHSYSYVGSVIPLLEFRREALRPLLDHKKNAVSKWAEDNIQYFDREIERHKEQEAEEKFLYS